MKLSDLENRNLFRYNHVFPNNKAILQDYVDQVKAGVASPKLNRKLIEEQLNVKQGKLNYFVEETGDAEIDASNKKAFEQYNKLIRLGDGRYDIYQRKLPPAESAMQDLPDNIFGNLAYGAGNVEAGITDALLSAGKGFSSLIGLGADVATGIRSENLEDPSIQTDVLGKIEKNFPSINTTGFSSFLGITGQYVGGYKIGEKILEKTISKKGQAWLAARAASATATAPRVSKIAIPVFKYGVPAAIGEPIVATSGDRTILQALSPITKKYLGVGVEDMPDPERADLSPKDRALELGRQKLQFGLEAPFIIGGLSAGFQGLFKFATPYGLKAGSIGKEYLGKAFDVGADILTNEARASILGVPTANLFGGSFIPSIVRGVNLGASKIRNMPGLNKIPPVSEWKLYNKTNTDTPFKVDGKINIDGGIASIIGRIDAMLRAVRTNEALTPAAKARQRRSINQLEKIKESIDRRFEVINVAISKIADDATSSNKMIFRKGANTNNVADLVDGSTWAKITFVDDFVKYITTPGMKGSSAFNLLGTSTRAQIASIKRELLTLRRMYSRAGLSSDDFMKGVGKDAYDYLTTSFRIVTQKQNFRADPENFKSVTKMIKNLLRYQPKMLEYRKTLAQQLEANNKTGELNQLYEEYLEGLAENRTRTWIEKGSADGMSSGKLIEMAENELRDIVGGHLKVLKTRKILKEGEQIPDIVSKLFGRVDDPKVIISNTIAELADAVVKQNMYDDFYKMGLNKWVFDTPDGLVKATTGTSQLGPNRTALQQIDLKGSNNSGLANTLNGKWTIPAMKESIETMGGVLWTDRFLGAPFVKMYLAGKSLSQVNLTVASPTTQIRNVTSAATFALAAGHVGNGASLKDAMYFIFRDVFTKNGIFDDAAIGKKMDEYLSEGIINNNMIVKEIEFLVKDSLRTGPAIFNTDALITRLYDTKAVSKLIDIYRAGDDLWKIYGYEYEKSLKNLSIKNIDDVVTYHRDVFGRVFDKEAYLQRIAGASTSARTLTRDEMLAPAIREMSSEIIKNVYPNYAYVPKLIQEMRRIPYGNFISFPAEMYRTQANLLRFSLKEIASKNKIISSQGGRRILGLSSALYLPFGAAELGRMMFDISPNLMNRFQRSFTPSWNQEGPLAITGLERNDKNEVLVQYIPTSYQFPHSATTMAPFYKALESIGTARESGESVMNSYVTGVLTAFGTALRPFATEGILTAALFDVSTRGGETAQGRTIFFENEDPGDKIAKGIAHIAKALFTPGGFVQINKFRKAGYNLMQTDRKDLIYTNQNEPFDFATEAMSLFLGIREYTVNIHKSFEKYEIRDFTKTLAFDRSKAAKELYSINMNPEEVYEAFYQQNLAEYRTFSKFYETIEDGLSWGITENEMRLMFKNKSGLDSKDALIIRKQFNSVNMPSFKKRGRLNELATDRGFKNVLEFIDPQRFIDIKRKFQGLELQLTDEEVMEQIKGIVEKKYQKLQEVSSVAPTTVPEIPIVQPQTIAAAAPPPINPAINPATGLSATEEALLSPSEKAIRLRNKTRTVV